MSDSNAPCCDVRGCGLPDSDDRVNVLIHELRDFVQGDRLHVTLQSLPRLNELLVLLKTPEHRGRVLDAPEPVLGWLRAHGISTLERRP